MRLENYGTVEIPVVVAKLSFLAVNYPGNSQFDPSPEIGLFLPDEQETLVYGSTPEDEECDNSSYESDRSFEELVDKLREVVNNRYPDGFLCAAAVNLEQATVEETDMIRTLSTDIHEKEKLAAPAEKQEEKLEDYRPGNYI